MIGRSEYDGGYRGGETGGAFTRSNPDGPASPIGRIVSPHTVASEPTSRPEIRTFPTTSRIPDGPPRRAVSTMRMDSGPTDIPGESFGGADLEPNVAVSLQKEPTEGSGRIATATESYIKPDEGSDVLDPATWQRKIEEEFPDFQGLPVHAGRVLAAMERGREGVVKLVEGTDRTVPRIGLTEGTSDSIVLHRTEDDGTEAILVPRTTLETYSFLDLNGRRVFNIATPDGPDAFAATSLDVFEIIGYEEAEHAALGLDDDSLEATCQAQQRCLEYAKERGMPRSLVSYLREKLEDAVEIRNAGGASTEVQDGYQPSVRSRFSVTSRGSSTPDDSDSSETFAARAKPLDREQIPLASRDQVEQALVRTDQLTADGNAVDCHIFGTLLCGGRVEPVARNVYDDKRNFSTLLITGDYVGIGAVDETALPTMQPLVLRDTNGDVKHTIVKLDDGQYISKLGHTGVVRTDSLKDIADFYETVEVAPVQLRSTVSKPAGESWFQYKAPASHS